MIQSHLARLLAAFFLLFCSVPSHAGKVIISPQDGVSSINKMIIELTAGDTMLFRPGVYKGPFTLIGINGLPNHPIVLMGISKGSSMTIIDGKSEPGMGLQNNAFQVEDCSWIVIEEFRIRNCWTDIITSVDVSYLSV
jgi:hypothetical protein